MHPMIRTLQSALAYATFTNKDIEAATMKHVETLGIDLDATNGDYQQGIEVEESEKELSEALNDADSSSEDTEAALRNVDGSEEIEEED